MNPQKIIDTANAFYDSCTLFAASDAGVFGKLAELGRADYATLASELKLDKRACRLLLDGCVSLGLLIKDGHEYSNSPESAVFLVPGSGGDLSKAIRYNRDVYEAWGKLPDFTKTGKPVEKPELHLGDDKQRTRTFVVSMHARAMAIGRAVVPLLELEGRKKLLDIGGGPAAYAVLIAKQFEGITCEVLDLPEVVKIADEFIEKYDLTERVKTLPGDYHDYEFPSGVDAVNFFGMLHQESPESIRDLFARAYEALEPGGVVHVMDMMTDKTRTAPKFSALFALNMALTTDNGWVFSDDELRGWLEDAGFSDFKVQHLPAPMPHWLAIAKK